MKLSYLVEKGNQNHDFQIQFKQSYLQAKYAELQNPKGNSYKHRFKWNFTTQINLSLYTPD